MPAVTVSRMPEGSQDPADTQMFRAFVARGEPEAPRRRWVLLLLLVALVVVAVVVVLSIAVS